MIAAWSDIATAAPAAFVLGLGVGWIVSQKFAIVRRSDEPGANRRKTDKRSNGS